jgi:hypothetical protein
LSLEQTTRGKERLGRLAILRRSLEKKKRLGDSPEVEN